MGKTRSLRIFAIDLRIYVRQCCLSTIVSSLKEHIGNLSEILVYFQYFLASDHDYNKMKENIYIFVLKTFSFSP